MKSFTWLVLIFLIARPSIGQNVNTVWPTPTVSANVGIGTSAAQEKLQIVGNLKINATTFSNVTYTKISWNMPIGTGASVFDNHRDLGNVGFIFNTTTGAPGSPTKELMRLDANGNVGIGTTTPRALLDIGVTSNNTLTAVLGRLAEGNGTGEGTFLGVRSLVTQPHSNNSFAIEHKFNNVLNSSINFYRGGGHDGGFLTFTTNIGTERMRINHNGNVGIGTINPLANLQLQTMVSGATVTSLRLSSQQDPINYYSDIINNYYSEESFKITNGGSSLFKASVNGYNFIEIGNTSGKKINLITALNRSITIPNGRLVIGSHPVETNPLWLDSTNKIFVEGTILSRKVRVTQTGWADYVFEEKYPLMPLSDLNQFIKTNHHLPEIPTKKEVTENGIDIGDMNALLLKKVEELTLYIIQQNKRIEALENKYKH